MAKLAFDNGHCEYEILLPLYSFPYSSEGVVKLSLTQISQFVAVVEERSFTGAAAQLRVAQPWLSTRVRQLEQQVGFRLLDRSPKGVSLTAEGQLFFDGAQALLRESASLGSLIARLAQGIGGTVRIGAIAESFYIGERNRLIDAFHQAFPSLAATLENRPDPELRRMLLRGDLDAAFITGTPPARLEAIRIRQGRCELLMPCDHALAASDAIPLAALGGQRVGVFPRSSNPAAWDESAGRLQAAGVELVTLSETLRDALIAQARRTGLMVLVLSSFGDHDMALEGMCVRPVADDDVRADFYLARRRQGPCDDALDRFWRFAQGFRLPDENIVRGGGIR
ncbi:DNA-binding transcriptional regulator, LysR family [Sphingobium faniae]|nr:DNA-binding transcriptional regulator, LysR family [Sphingobium faniae]